jgi:hypothetical protein
MNLLHVIVGSDELTRFRWLRCRIFITFSDRLEEDKDDGKRNDADSTVRHTVPMTLFSIPQDCHVEEYVKPLHNSPSR